MAPSFRTCHDRSGPLALCLVAACSVFYALEALRAAPAPSALHTSVRLPPPQTAPRPFAGGTRTAPGNQPSPRSLPTPGGPRPLRSSQPSPVPVPAPVRPQKRQPEAVGVPRALREWGLLCVAAAVGLWLPLRLGLGLGMALSAVAMATGLGGTVGLATGLGLGLGAGLVGCLAPGHTDADGAGARGCEYVAMLSTSGSPAPDPDVPPKVIGRRQWLAGGLGAAAAAGAAGAAARALAAAPVAEVQAGAQPEEQALVADVPLPAVARVQKALARFALGGVAGGIGATAVYPVDFVKTRMQAQEEPQTPAQVAAAVTPAAAPVPDDAEDPPVVCYLYESGWDCAMRTAREAGPGALYRGLGAQLLGVAPEKAIKLTVNDVLRQALWAPGAVPLWGAMLCGAAAGTAQVLVTNPLEIVKIRLQMQNPDAPDGDPGSARASALDIVQDLGLSGLYKGALACILRDAPFSAIFFPTYAALKETLPDSPLSLLVAGFVAGCPAAYLVTPMDVVKTRLQVDGAEDVGIPDMLRTICDNEGPGALFKGGVERVGRSAPQFAVTLFVFDTLNTLLPNLQ